MNHFIVVLINIFIKFSLLVLFIRFAKNMYLLIIVIVAIIFIIIVTTMSIVVASITILTWLIYV